MADPFIGEIRIFSFPFAPRGWAFANGQLLPIAQNQALFALYGTIYGGNGTTTFALPNLQGRVAMSFSGTHPQGQASGEAGHTLSLQEIPGHTHVPNANSAPGSQPGPAGGFWAADSHQNTTFGTTTNVKLNPAAVGSAGGNQPHSNLMPYLTLNFCVALQGIFPSRN